MPGYLKEHMASQFRLSGGNSIDRESGIIPDYVRHQTTYRKSE